MTTIQYIDSLIRSLYSDYPGSFICAQCTKRSRSPGAKAKLGLELLMAEPLDAEDDLRGYLAHETSGQGFPTAVTMLPECFAEARALGEDDNTCVEFTVRQDADLKEVAEQLVFLRTIFDLAPLSVLVNGLSVVITAETTTVEAISAALSTPLRMQWYRDRVELLEGLRRVLLSLEDSPDAPPAGVVWKTGTSVSLTGPRIAVSLDDAVKPD
jgi:hypothetical protein